MPVWAVTGKLGAGKTLVAVSRIQKYLNEGRRVATNLDLTVENLVNPWAKKTDIVRIPDVPSVCDFNTIGLGYEGRLQGDHKNGLIVLDECAKWLNSRSWNDKSRKKLIDYFVHLRKKRWDLLLIIQDIEALDSQFRKLYCEHIVYCSRSDRYKIPFIGPILSLFWGDRIPLPRIHIGNVYYVLGDGKHSHVENWIYRGTKLFDAYDTEQGFNEDTSPAIYSYLPPNTVYGRYVSKKEQLKKNLKKLGFTQFFFIGLIAGGFVTTAFEVTGDSPDRGLFTCNRDWEKLFDGCDLTKAQVKKIIEEHRNKGNGEKEPSTVLSVPGSLKSADVHPLEGVVITGSVANGSQHDYLFQKDGETYQPYEHGYRVYDVDECKAVLVNLSDRNDRKDIYCNFKV